MGDCLAFETLIGQRWPLRQSRRRSSRDLFYPLFLLLQKRLKGSKSAFFFFAEFAGDDHHGARCRKDTHTANGEQHGTRAAGVRNRAVGKLDSNNIARICLVRNGNGQFLVAANITLGRFCFLQVVDAGIEAIQNNMAIRVRSQLNDIDGIPFTIFLVELELRTFQAFLLIGAITLVLNALVYALVDPILLLLQIPPEVTGLTKTYLLWVFAGIVATFLYNFFANLLRAVGNSVTPLLFLGISVVLNIGLDLLFVVPLQMGVQGAALATVISQYLAGLGLAGYTWKAFPALRVRREDRVWNKATLRQLLSLSGFTCLQQSVMNFGILMVQGLVNSFGTTVMAAFAVAVKIDTLAYMPVQDFGNAFSTFVAQNFGAQKRARIRSGTRWAVFWVVVFCLVLGGLVCLLAPQLMAVFVGAEAVDVIAVGTGYLRIEGAFYLGIGILFLLYGYFRAVNRPAVSVVLTVCSLGTRVALAYALSALPALGVTGIWMAIPIGWFLADLVGILLWRREDRQSR